MTTSEDRDEITRLEVAYEFIRENMATQADVALLEGKLEALDEKMNAMANRLLLRFVAVAVVMSSVIVGVLKL